MLLERPKFVLEHLLTLNGTIYNKRELTIEPTKKKHINRAYIPYNCKAM